MSKIEALLAENEKLMDKKDKILARQLEIQAELAQASAEVQAEAVPQSVRDVIIKGAAAEGRS